MDEISAMKGAGKLIATVASRHSTTKLMMYADGSYGIMLNDRIAGTWEPVDQAQCFDTFLAISGAKTGLSAVVLRVHDHPLRTSMCRMPVVAPLAN